MKDEEINQAIAEWMGWKRMPQCDFETILGKREVWVKDGRRWWRNDLPRFCSDLNAMREAIKYGVSNGKLEWRLFLQQLKDIVCADADEPVNNDPETLFDMVNASARQRAEGLLRTVGVWR